jgi:hypothetical protein
MDQFFTPAVRILLSKIEFSMHVGPPKFCEVGSEIWDELTHNMGSASASGILAEAFGIEVRLNKEFAPDSFQFQA